MKHIKEYKWHKILNNNRPEKGDYVICQEDGKLDEFLSLNIGQVKYIDSYDKIDTLYTVGYDKISYEVRSYFSKRIEYNQYLRNMLIEEIKYWSKNKEDLEVILQANKYNL